MNYKFSIIGVVFVFLVTFFSGCTEQTNIESIADEIQVSSNGGYFSLAQSKVDLDIPADAVSGDQSITVNKISSPPALEEYSFVTGYDFQPDGLEFGKPVTLKILYDDQDIPAGVQEKDLVICLYENGQLTEIDNCVCYPDMNLVRGEITHFCVFWVCSGSGGGGGGGSGSGTGGGNSSGNHSAIIRFDVDTLEVVEKHWVYPEENPIWEHYRIDTYFVWDPVTYVRFYEITYSSTGPFHATRSYLNWNDYKTSGYPSPTSFLHEDPEIYIYGDFKYYPGYGNFVTIYDNLKGNFPNKHGIEVFSILGSWDVSLGSLSYSPPDVIAADMKAMKAALYEWTQGWLITVRAVT